MAIWQVEVFDNPDDAAPVSRGFVEAESEEQAVEMVLDAMGHAKRADMNPVAKQLGAIPNGIVLWDHF